MGKRIISALRMKWLYREKCGQKGLCIGVIFLTGNTIWVGDRGRGLKFCLNKVGLIFNSRGCLPSEPEISKFTSSMQIQLPEGIMMNGFLGAEKGC